MVECVTYPRPVGGGSVRQPTSLHVTVSSFSARDHTDYNLHSALSAPPPSLDHDDKDQGIITATEIVG